MWGILRDPLKYPTQYFGRVVHVDAVSPRSHRYWQGLFSHDPNQSRLRQASGEDAPLDYDVVVCGGTLGIFIATMLRLRGIVDVLLGGGVLRGREQEWNISMEELELVELGVISEEDVDAAVMMEFPCCRSGFKNEEGEMATLFLNIPVSAYIY